MHEPDDSGASNAKTKKMHVLRARDIHRVYNDGRLTVQHVLFHQSRNILAFYGPCANFRQMLGACCVADKAKIGMTVADAIAL